MAILGSWARGLILEIFLTDVNSVYEHVFTVGEHVFTVGGERGSDVGGGKGAS